MVIWAIVDVPDLQTEYKTEIICSEFSIDQLVSLLCNHKSLQLEALYHVQFGKVSSPLCEMSEPPTNTDASISLELKFLREMNPVVHAIT